MLWDGIKLIVSTWPGRFETHGYYPASVCRLWRVSPTKPVRRVHEFDCFVEGNHIFKTNYNTTNLLRLLRKRCNRVDMF